jgi:hypothetical protein
VDAIGFFVRETGKSGARIEATFKPGAKPNARLPSGKIRVNSRDTNARIAARQAKPIAWTSGEIHR